MAEQPFTPGIGVDIGSAAVATRAVLDALLERAGLDFNDWIALVTAWNAAVANAEPIVSRGTLQNAIATRLSADQDKAAAVLAHLESAGLITGTESSSKGMRLTAAGEHTFRTLRDSITRQTAVELDGIAGTDVETTQRVLRLIAERARAFVAA